MNHHTDTPSRASDLAAGVSPVASARVEAAAPWPPGPAAGLTGWGLLREMSQDMLSALGRWQQRHGDVVHLRIWPEHEVVLTDPALVRELLVTHHEALVRWERGVQVFAQVHGHSVLTSEGQAWRTKRHTLQPVFTPKAVQAFVPTVRQAATQALGRWPTEATAVWPIESALTSLAMDVIVRMLFSAPIGDEARQAEQAVHTLSVVANSEFYWPVSAPDWLPWKRTKREALATLRGLIDRQLQARVAMDPAQHPEDVLTRLLRLHRDDPAAWPLQAVRDECMTAFLAGHETVAASLTWWAWCMATHPALQQRVADEVLQAAGAGLDVGALPLLTQTLQETMRLYPAAPVLMTRRNTAALRLGPWQFPARTLFLVPVRLMHLDARWFPEPEAFKPERFAPGAAEIPRGAYMPFGTGPRVCLGQHLAMTEMTVVAALVLQRFELQVPPGAAAPQPVLNVTLRPQEPLQLSLRPRW